jgi:hypothetical protein
MPTVYIETSILSYYFDTRREPRIVAWREATREWWNLHRDRYDLCTSELTLLELRGAPSYKAQDAVDLLRDVRMLDPIPGTIELTEFYIQQRLMPQGRDGDAGHLAMASMHGVDFLLTWNCQHLANANKTMHLQVLNGRLGLRVPILTTPLTLMPED